MPGTVSARYPPGSPAPGASARDLAIEGTYTQTILGTLEIELGGLVAGTEYDQLTVTGNADLAGTLNLVIIDNFEIEVGQQFTILTAASVTGQFDEINCPTKFVVSYEPSAVVATVTSVCVADIDCDGNVATADLLALLAAWGSDPGGPPDLDGNGNVSTSDLLALLGAWGPCR